MLGDAMSAKLQKETLEYFRCGKVELLFATDVVEDGINVPKCSTVICFNIPKRVRQSGSQFIIMLERGNEEQRERICDILRSGHSMNDDAKQERDPDACVVKPCKFKETGSYSVDSLIHDEDPPKNKSTKKAKASPSVAVLKSINTQKGGPRASLFELCCKMKWSTPILTSSEEKSKSFNSFESSVSLNFPDCGVIEVTGEPRADKKSSLDCAALLMLYELQKRGKLKIGEESE
ncbi:uncharacterized protein LOC143584668 [Bidens hawaiensis]|uniref:uncharacterized protein LOC143584668 n=1 Tax=Bidens hawaiensis TaxID=980011 RepID=UPI00404A93B1